MRQITRKKCECGNYFVYLKTILGEWMPVDTDSLSVEDKETLNKNIMIIYDKEKHTTHFGTCPLREKLKKEKSKIAPKPKLLGYFVYREINNKNHIISKIISQEEATSLIKHLKMTNLKHNVYLTGMRYKKGDGIEDKFL